ncbi:MAG: hypothetical protein ACLGIA_12565 [Actinomycetes bacterium]
MTLSREQTTTLRALHTRLGQLSLQPNDPFYVDVHRARYQGAAGEDIVGQLLRDVAWSEAPSLAFMSGFRGAGKSTQLNRLALDLEDEGFAVLKFDVEQYLETRIPITVVHLVYALAAGARDAAVTKGWLAEGRVSSFGSRFLSWLKGLRIEGQASVNAPFSDWLPVDFEATLRRDPTFRDEVDKFLRDRSVELHRQADEFLGEVQKAIRERFAAEGRDWLGVVLLVDSLDHVRSETQFQKVRDALAEIFDMQVSLLRFQEVRTLFCVPPWLRSAAGTVRRIYNVKVADRAGDAFEGGYELLTDVLERRLPPRCLLGDFLDPTELRRVIALSGGHMCDYLRMLDDVVLRIHELPAPSRDVDRAVTQIRGDFLPLADDERLWLQRIAKSHELSLRTQDEWEGLAGLLDRHLVLRYPDEEPWYAVPDRRGRARAERLRLSVSATVTLSALGEAEWERLRRLLSWSDGFWLSFMYVEKPAPLPLLRERVGWNRSVNGEPLLIRVARSAAELSGWTSGLVEQLCPPRGVTWLEGVPSSVDDEWADAWSRVLVVLNRQRDTIRSRAGGVVLVMPGALQSLPSHRASDLWSVRSPSFTVDRRWLSAAGRPDEVPRAPAEQGSTAREGHPLAVGTQAPAGEITRRTLRWLAADADGQGWIDEAVEIVQSAEHQSLDQLAAVVILRAARHLAETEPTYAAHAVAEGLALGEIDDGTRAQLLDVAGQIAFAQRDLERSKDCWLEALMLRRKRATQERSADLLRDLAFSLDNVGAVSQATEDWATAQTAYTESCHLRRRLVEQAPSAQSLRDLSVSLNKVGMVRRATDDCAGAAAAFTESVRLRRQLADTSPTPSALRDLAVSLVLLGSTIDLQSDPSRQELMREARVLAEQLGDEELLEYVEQTATGR